MPLASDLKKLIIQRTLRLSANATDDDILKQLDTATQSITQRVGGLGARHLDEISLERCIQLLSDALGRPAIVEPLRETLDSSKNLSSGYNVCAELVEF